jgi:23S rRNA pseudouridine1911/1915/1917 synthase
VSERAVVVVTADLDGVRLDRTLAVLADMSRATARRAVESGEVLLSGRPADKSTVPRAGDEIEYPLPPDRDVFVPEPVSFVVAADLGDVLVVDKPSGLVVHPGSGNQEGTLAHGLAHRYPELAALGTEYRWGLVHRLDRDTSGLLLVARTPSMHRFLQRQLQKRRVGRTYLALVSGHLDSATGTIEAPIGRDPRRPTRMAVVHDGRPARTRYRRLVTWRDCTLVEVELDTGRTHQIRVHFDSIGHGLIGDATYGPGEPHPGDPGRVWLHAARLRFPLPDGTEHEIESALPEDLAASLAALGDPETVSPERRGK